MRKSGVEPSQNDGLPGFEACFLGYESRFDSIRPGMEYELPEMDHESLNLTSFFQSIGAF